MHILRVDVVPDTDCAVELGLVPTSWHRPRHPCPCKTLLETHSTTTTEQGDFSTCLRSSRACSMVTRPPLTSTSKTRLRPNRPLPRFKTLHKLRLLLNTRDEFDMSLSPVNENGNFTQAGRSRPSESQIPFPRDTYTTSEKGITFVAAQQRW